MEVSPIRAVLPLEIGSIAARTLIAASAMLLVVLASDKFLNPAEFHDVLRQHGLLPEQLLSVSARLVPIAELLIGVSGLHELTAGRRRRASLMFSVLALVFALYALALTWKPPFAPAPCGCGFSSRPVESWFPIVVRNGGICALFAAGGAVLRDVPPAPRRGTRSPISHSRSAEEPSRIAGAGSWLRRMLRW